MLNHKLQACCLALYALILFAAIAVAQDPSQIAQQASEAMQAGNYPQAEVLYAKLSHQAPNVPEVYSNLGLARYEQKKYDPSREAFVSALRLNPSLFVPNFFLAKIDSEIGRYATALPHAEKALKTQPENRSARRLLASILVGLKRDDLAIVEYQKLLGDDSSDVDSLYDLALVYLDLGKFAYDQLQNYKLSGFIELVVAEHDVLRGGFQVAALQKYGQAINGSPTVPGLRTALGNFLLQSGQWQKADREFQEELTVDPFSYEAQLGLARTAWAQQHCDAAVDDLDKAVAIRPEFFDPLVDIFSDLPAHGDGTACAAIEKLANGHESFGAALLLGRLAEDRGQSGQAASWHDRAEARRDELIQKFRAAAGATPVTTPSLTVRENLGLQLLQRKRYVEGLALLSPFLAKASTAPEIIVPEARALFALKRYPDVINLLSRGRPGTPEEYYLRGASCHQLAWQLIQRIEEVDPQSARLDELRASAFAAEQMLPEAVREYETAIKLEPDNARLYFDLGNTHIDEREFTKAEAAYAQACRLKPLFAEAYAMRGYALLALSRPGEAVPQLRRALQINPDLMSAHALLAKALAGSGHEAEAAKELEIVKCTDTDGGLHFQLFVLYRRLGNSEKATQALNDSERIRREQRQSLENDVGPPIPSGFQVESNN